MRVQFEAVGVEGSLKISTIVDNINPDTVEIVEGSLKISTIVDS